MVCSKRDISPSEGHFTVKTIMADILKGRSKPKCSKLATSKGLSDWRISKGTTDGHFGPPWFFAQILCMMTVPLYGHGMMTQKGTLRNSCLVPYTLQPFKALTPERNPLKGLGHRHEPLWMECRVCQIGRQNGLIGLLIWIIRTEMPNTMLNKWQWVHSFRWIFSSYPWPGDFYWLVVSNAVWSFGQFTHSLDCLKWLLSVQTDTYPRKQALDEVGIPAIKWSHAFVNKSYLKTIFMIFLHMHLVNSCIACMFSKQKVYQISTQTLKRYRMTWHYITYI